MWHKDTEDLPYLSETSYGVFALTLAPILIYFAFAWSVDTGIIYTSRNEELWAVHSKLPINTVPAAPLDDSTVISLRRGICFLWCPNYRLKIFGSGRVEYYGYGSVCAYGAQTARADTREIARLVEAMTAAGYFGYSWQEGPFGFDAPSADTSLRRQGRSFEIHHYYGDAGAPRWLRSMEAEIDRVAGSARWLPTYDKEGLLKCPDGDGGVRDVTMDEPPHYSSWSTEPKIDIPKIRTPPPPKLLDPDL